MRTQVRKRHHDLSAGIAQMDQHFGGHEAWFATKRVACGNTLVTRRSAPHTSALPLLDLEHARQCRSSTSDIPARGYAVQRLGQFFRYRRNLDVGSRHRVRVALVDDFKLHVFVLYLAHVTEHYGRGDLPQEAAVIPSPSAIAPTQVPVHHVQHDTARHSIPDFDIDDHNSLHNQVDT